MSYFQIPFYFILQISLLILQLTVYKLLHLQVLILVSTSQFAFVVLKCLVRGGNMFCFAIQAVMSERLPLSDWNFL